MIRRNWLKSAGTLLVVALGATTTALVLAPSAHADTTVLSESFESSTDLPSGWKLETFTAGVSTATIGTGTGAEGSHFLKIVSTKANHARVLIPVSVTPGASYHFQVQAKSRGASDSAAAAVLGVDGQYSVTDSVRTDDSWQPLDLYLSAGSQSTVNLTMGLGNFGQLNAGEADFDAVVLTQIDSIPTDAKTVITLAQAATPAAAAASSAGPSASGGSMKSFWVFAGFLVALIVAVSALLTLRGGASQDPTIEPTERRDAPSPEPAVVAPEKTRFLDVPSGNSRG